MHWQANANTPLFVPPPCKPAGSQDPVAKLFPTKPNSKTGGQRYNCKKLTIAICSGLPGPFKAVIACLKARPNKHRIAKHNF